MGAKMIYVFGLGNVLMGDDGFGPAVIQRLQAEYQIEGDVEAIDLGTPGLDLTPWFADVDSILIVDTIKSDLPAGTVRVYSKPDLVRFVPVARTSPHDPGVKETLLTLEFAGRAPREVGLIGVVPERTDLRLDLSAPVEAAVPRALAVAVDWLADRGVTVKRRVGWVSPSGGTTSVPENRRAVRNPQ